MTAPKDRFTIRYESQDELVAKLRLVLRKLGWESAPVVPQWVSVSELARRAGRGLTGVSKALRAPHCPPYRCIKGKRRITAIEPSEALLSWLRNNYAGARHDLSNAATKPD